MNKKRLLAAVLAVLGSSVMMWADDENDIIQFADTNVKAVCIENWDTDGDGELSKAEAAAVTSLGTAFKQNNNITSFKELRFFTSLTSISTEAFYQCKSLTEVEIPENVKSIDKKAFCDCWVLENVVLPVGVTYIGVSAFQGCKLTSITIPEGVTSIGKYAFYCSGLTDIIVPSTVTYWGTLEFCQCNYLVSATILGKPTSLAATFASCKKLEHANIPESVTTLETTFNDCINLKSIFIPKSVTSIATGSTSVFYNCYNLEEIVVDEENTYYDSRDNCNALIRTNGNQLMWGCRNTVIPSTIQSIKEQAFYGVKGLTEITIPAGCTSIGYSAFKGCTDLLKVTSKVETPYAVSAFDNATIKNGVLIVPQGCREAYAQTDGWKNFLIYEEGEVIYGKNYTDEQGIKYTLNDDKQSYRVSGWDAGRLTENVVIPADLGGCPVTSIGNSAFSGCSLLHEITLPASIASIGNSSFKNCNNLARVYSKIQTPYAVSTFNWNTCILIVPQGTKAAYKSVSGWKDAIIFEEGETIYDKVYTDGQGIKYTLYQDDAGFRYSVTGHSDQLTAELTIPDDIDGCPVTSITYQAFQNCTNLTKVTLPASLTSVSFAAFNGCTNLTEFVSQIQDPTKVTASMSSEVTARAILWVPGGSKAAYLATSGWKDFIIYEEGVDVAFDRTPTDGQGVKYLLSQSAGNLYYSVTGHSDALAKRVIIPTELDGVPVTHIAAGSFKDCTELTWIYIPESIIEMPSREETFNGCSLTLALNQETVSGWSVSPFITGLEIGNNVKTIDSYAFWGCRSLASIEWPQNQQTLTVKSLAFEYCTGLTEITIPKGLSIDDGAFSGCTSVEKVNWNAATCGTRPRGWFPSVRELYIGKDVTTIDYGVTSGCANLERIVVDAENTTYDSRGNCNAIIDTAGNGLVAGCKNTVIPNNITSIWTEAFKGHTGLTSVTIPASVTIIGINAFSGCTGLTSVTIPASVTRIGGTVNNSNLTPGNNAFKGCTSLIHVTSYIQKPFGVNAFDSETLASATLTVPFGRRGFYQKASGWGFQNIEEMEGNEEETTFIQFADATTKSICIGKWDENGDGEISLYEAKQVTSVSFYNANGSGSITSFDELKYFTNVTAISNNAFKGCKNLISIILPDGVSSIGSYAFYGCESLDSINIPEGVTAINDYTLYNCKSLASITMPDGVNSIGSYAFQNCSALKDITLPEGLTSIGQYAFSGTGLKEMTLPSTLTSIGNYALTGYAIHCRFTTPFSVYKPHSGNASNVLLYVPQGSEQLFRNATGWKDFLVLGEGGGHIDWAEGQITVTVDAAGGLRLALVELDDEEITRLKVRGPLNSTDIKYLIEGTGKIANLESLDLSDVSLVYDGGCYKQTSTPSDVGLGSDVTYYYLTEEELTTHSGPGLGLTSSTKTTYNSPYLAGAFGGKTYKRVVMPRSVKKAATSVFSYCKNLQYVEFPGGLYGIEYDAFCGCVLLDSISLEHVDSIPESAFSDCKALQKVDYLENVRYLGSDAFSGCSRLAGMDGTLSLPYAETISERAFRSCISLKKVVLPDALTAIGDYAFYGCSQLQQVSGLASLQDVNYTCFQSTPWMDALPVEDGIKYLGHIALSYGATDNAPATLYFRTGTTVIADRFWETVKNQTGVTAVSLPATLKRIGKQAFKGNNLTTLALPASLESIGEEAFYSSSQLTKVTIPEGVTQIGESAFSSCGQLMIVNYNAHEAEGKNFFYGCSSLEKVNVGASVRLLPQGIFYSCGNLTLVKFAERTGGIPLAIGDEAFNRCQNLASIALPQGTTAIGSDAFYYCQSLTSLPLPSSVKTIGDRAFYYCEALTAVTLSSSLKSIGDNAFNGCTGITSLALPSALESIGKEAFKECTGLSSCAISNKVTVINNGTFGKCSKLTSVTLPKGLKVIGDDAFSNCEKLSTIELPTKLDSIGCCAFGGCTSLRKIVIPATVTKLGSNFLYDCINMDTIVCHIAQPKDISGIISLSTNVYDVYLNYIYSNDCYMRTNLIVPDGCKPLYQATEGWKKFKKIREESGHEFTATNKLAVYSSVALAPGKTVRIPVRLQNDVTDFVGFQLDFQMRSGFSIALNANGQPDIRLSERCPDGMTVTAEQVSVNQYFPIVKYRIVCESPWNAPIRNNDGPLMYITVKVPDTYREGSYDATIDNVYFTQADGTRSLLDFVPFWIKVDASEADRTILDENAVVAPTMATGVDVRVFRHFDAVSWNTICLPFAISSSELERATGYLDLADFQGWDTEEDEWGNTIRLNLRFRSFWGEMEANHPYLLKVWKDVAAFDLNGIDLNPASDPSVQVTVQKAGQPAKHGSMTGTYTATTVPANCFYIKDDGFHYSDDSSEIKGFRAWFNLDDVLQDKENPRISIFINDRETSISGTPSMKQDDDAVYDLSGRKIVNNNSSNGTLPRGIYIVNGKKVLVK